MRFELASAMSTSRHGTFIDFSGAEEAPPLTEAHAVLKAAKRALANAVTNQEDKGILEALAHKVEEAKDAFFEAVRAYEGRDLIVSFIWDEQDAARTRLMQLHVDKCGRLFYFEEGAKEQRTRTEFIHAIAKPIKN